MKKLGSIVGLAICLPVTSFAVGPRSTTRSGPAGDPGRASAAGTPSESSASPGAMAVPGPQLPLGTQYYLTVNDQIAVTVRDHPEFSLSEAVRSDGKIAYPLLQNVAVAGKTVDQVRDEIKRGLADYIRNPDVTVVVVGYHSENIYVVGSVRQYGRFDFTRGLSAQEAIRLAGGMDPDADSDHVSIVRNHRAVAIVDAADPSAKPYPLQADDTIFVPKRSPEMFTLVGAVTHPGTQPLQPHERLLDALSGATQTTDSSASASDAASSGPSQASWQDSDLTHVTLTRGSQVRTIDASPLIKGDLGNNILIEPGDVIFVPPAAQITVVGDVQKPGPQALAADERILNVLLAAGAVQTGSSGTGPAVDPTQGAPDLAHTTITRAGHVQTVDVAAVLAGNLANNVPIEAGDVVYVPPASRIMVVGAVQKPGSQALWAGEKVLEALTAAGIPTPGSAGGATLTSDSTGGTPDLAHTTLTRGGNVRTIDAAAILGGNLAANETLEPGDVLYVPPAAHITVVGAVQRPGTQTLAPNEHILEAITAAGVTNAAGGPATTLASNPPDTQGPGPDLAHAVLTRNGQQRIVNLDAVMRGSTIDNIALEPGDIIYIPTERIGTVTVLGEVNHPQAARLGPAEHVLDLLQQVGGGATSHAQLDHAVLKRLDGSTVNINLETMLNGQNSAQNLELRDGDELTVPTNPYQVAVVGAVTRPGVYDFKPGDSVMQAMILAGGYGSTADLRRVAILRYDKDGHEQRVVEDLSKELQGKAGAASTPLATRDIIYVPDRKGPQGPSALSTALSVLPFVRWFIPF